MTESRTRCASRGMILYQYSVYNIVHNDTHNLGRQSSNLAHELAHALLHHLPALALNDVGGRNWDQTVEDEANWLGGSLLISEEAALLIARKKWSYTQAAAYYKVSEEMIWFRLNVTGAQKRMNYPWSSKYPTG
jgi:Zn-dependent peptidase ImmA (M78 family)